MGLLLLAIDHPMMLLPLHYLLCIHKIGQLTVSFSFRMTFHSITMTTFDGPLAQILPHKSQTSSHPPPLSQLLSIEI